MPTDILADYASGTLPAGMSLLVASHLTYSPASRSVVAGYESVGAGLFMAETETPDVTPPSLEATLALIDAAPEEPSPGIHPDTPLPAPVLETLGKAAEDVPWKFRLPGLSEYVLDGFAGEEVSLMRARPGAMMLSHTHTGVEATLVLSGQMEDRGRTLTRGDVLIATPDDDHRPEITGEETCYCLIVMTGDLRFTGVLSRALNILGE